MTPDERTTPALWQEPPPDLSGVTPDAFPPLHANGAYPVAQDRWERLVSTVHIAAPADRVWSALTDPDQVAQWLAVCRGRWGITDGEAILDFEDGEFFLCRNVHAQEPGEGEPGRLAYLWRWVGVGPATSVTWSVLPQGGGSSTAVTVIEEAKNPPSDWRSWNGMGWPGILDQLASFIRTGTPWRWPWRRMGPYLQAELPGTTFEAWAMLTDVPAAQFWLSRAGGSLAEGDSMTLVLGDASGMATLRVLRHIEAYQQFPSYLPRIEFALARGGWPAELAGHLWIEPAGLGRSLLQVFHSGWEALGATPPPLAERKILTDFWVGALRRATMLCAGRLGGGPPGAGGQPGEPGGAEAGPHSWSR